MAEPAAPKARRIRKFYQQVTVGESGGLYVVLLDGKPAKTPARAALGAPNPALADAVAGEWAGEGDSVDFDGLRLTRLAATVIDLAEAQRDQWAEEVVSYARSDLLCYRAEGPAALTMRQSKAWTPYLAWARGTLGAGLTATEGVVAIEQPDEAVEAIRRAAAALDDWRLIGAHRATTLTGSAVLALALERGAFPAADIFVASRLDERFQAEQWGEDAEASAREARIEAEFMAAARWLSLLG